MGEVDPTFIQQLEHIPKPEVIEAQGIPQIDLSPLLNSSSPADVHADLVAQVLDACENWGFFQVFNHGIPVESREKLMSAAKRFFDQPMEENGKVRRDEAHPLGYYDTEHTKNVRDWKEVFDVTVDVPTLMWASHEPDDQHITHYLNQWPHHPFLRSHLGFINHLIIMGEVDPTFIQELQHRPTLAVVEAEGIPQIDLSPFINPPPSGGNAAAIEDLIYQVRDACKNWGFFQVINHGVPVEVREKLQSAAKSFFDQPVEEKKKVRRGEENPYGYYDTEHTKNVRDWKEVFDFTVEVPTSLPASYESHEEQIAEYSNQWPYHPPELREASEVYVTELQKLSYKLLELISLSLNLPANRLEPFFSKDQTTFVRLNHYPPCPAPDLALGVGRHKDAGALTILAQDDVGGLEVKRKSDGEWIFVKPTPDSFIINVGDIIQVWSNDRYESVEHRVKVNSGKERFSIPFFVNPAHYTVVEPLAELTDEGNPAKYESYNWGKFFVTRKYSDFKKLDVENIQIYHFKKPDKLKVENVVNVCC